MPLPKGMSAPEQVNASVDFGISDIGSEEWDKLYPWIQKIIEDSDEGKAYFTENPKTESAAGGTGNPDDEVPF